MSLYVNMFIMFFFLALRPNVFFLYISEINLKPNLVHSFANRVHHYVMLNIKS
jgi:hypothetical protein